MDAWEMAIANIPWGREGCLLSYPFCTHEQVLYS